MGDLVLLRRGNQPEGLRFEARMWQVPNKVSSVQQPLYELENAPVRRFQKLIHVRGLRLYIQCEDVDPKIEN